MNIDKPVAYPDFVKPQEIKANKEKIAEITTTISFSNFNVPNIINSQLYTREYLEIPLIKGGTKKICFCLMNPSKADSKSSDNTVNAVLNFVDSIEENKEEFQEVGKVVIVNLFPFYETSSKLLGAVIGYFRKDSREDLDRKLKENQKEIKEQIKCSDWIVLGWGNCPEKLESSLHKKERDNILGEIYSLQNKSKIYIFQDKNNKGVTQEGQPRHPIRLDPNTLEIADVEIKKNKERGDKVKEKYIIHLKEE